VKGLLAVESGTIPATVRRIRLRYHDSGLTLGRRAAHALKQNGFWCSDTPADRSMKIAKRASARAFEA
jgi:hypothetical protein